MAENETRDPLFGVDLGDMIEIPDEKEEKKIPEVTGDGEEKKKEETTDDGVSMYDDGTFEIDEFTEEKKKAVEETAKDTETFIEKTETEEKDKGKKDPDGDKTGDSSPSSSPYLAFARDRANEGVFLDFTDEEWKQLVEENEGDEAAALRQISNVSVQAMIRNGIEQFKNSLTPEEKMLYEAKEKGLPVDEYALTKKSLQYYKGIDKDSLVDNEDLQTEIVRKALEIRGFSKEEIDEEIDGYKSLEKLEDKANKALELLPGYYEKKLTKIEDDAKARDEAAKDQIRQRVAKMKQLVDNVPEIVPGIKLTKPTRQKIMESMTKPVAKDEDGNLLNPVMVTRMKNPEAFEMMLHYYHTLGLFNMDEEGNMKPDFSKITNKVKTKAVDSMRSVFETKGKTSTGRPNVPKSQEDELDEFDKAFSRL